MTQKILILGGTGAMGMYLVPELLERRFQVDVTTREARKVNNKNLRYIQGNAHDLSFLHRTLNSNKYDAIVDFMNYPTEEFRSRYDLLLKKCKHYIFLSSYRVFSDTEIITEKSPRLLDVSTDKEYLKTDDYALAKARQENILREASKKNWTIVRPAITYSSARFQLGTLEADTLVWRTLNNLPVILPREMLDKTTTMTWAYDVSRLIAKLVLVKKAMGEDFNLATTEHHTWSEVVKLYSKTIDLKVKPVGLEEYIEALGGGLNKYQVKYDRMFDRILDNTKVLRVTGEKQKNFTKLQDGLKLELTKFIENPSFGRIDYARQARFDRLTRTKIDLSGAGVEDRRTYQELRFPRRTRLKKNLRPRTRAKKALLNTRQVIRPRTRIKSLVKKAYNKYSRQKYKNADGLIITLRGYYNYGNIIQLYALQEFLRQKGYKFVSYANGPKQSGLDFNGPNFKRVQKTKKFVEKRIQQIPFNLSDNFPTYIVGSDQVWRNWGYQNETEDLGYYFLNFVKDSHAKRIAYAVSFGQDSLKDAMVSPEFVKYAKPLVKKFDKISVRENSGGKIIQKTWRARPQQVCDPSMLLTADDYDKLIKESLYKLDQTSPIFVYMLASSEDKTRIVQKIAHTVKKKVDNLPLYQINTLQPVEQWLKNFRDSELVITDSFHGTVFAIINNTPFIVIENAEGGISRIINLLKQFGLEDRLVTESKADKFDSNKLEPIDWQDVNNRVSDFRKDSSDWLLNALDR